MNMVSKKAQGKFLRIFTVLTAATTMLSLSGVAYLAPSAHAAAPADFGLTEGDTISAAGSDDPDVYIVNELGFKRLFLNPAIFGFYGHLGGFANVKNVSPTTRDAFPTSGLFRNCETGDQKVYGVETTGEDTGMLHWVNTTGAQAVADDPDFFKKVFCINNNEFSWYTVGSNYTSVNDVPDYTRGSTPTPSGPLSVSLSPSSPSSKTVTTNAQAYELMVVRLTGNGTVNSMTFKRNGAGATGDFNNLYVYDGATRITSGKSLSSSEGTVTFVNLDVSVSGSKDLALVGDLNGTAGNVDYFMLTAVSASGSVGGLPVNGISSQITFAGASSGTYDVAKSGSLGNPNVGQKKAQLSEFKVTANTEAGLVKRVTLFQGGTVKPGDITNAKLTTGTSEWAGSVTGDGYLVFDLGSGFSIKKGGNSIFKVWGDLGGKADETVILYLEENNDLWAIGDQFGFAMAEGTNTLDTSSEAHTVTLQGGTLTITFNGPNASNIGTDTDDTVLMEYSMTAQSNVEVRKTEFTLCRDDGGEGTYDDSHDTTNGWADLDDFKVSDADSGAVVLGPQDGSAFTTNDAGSCEDAATGAQKSLNDTFDLSAGTTRNFRITADIKTANTRSGVALTAADKIKVVLDNYTDDTPDLAVMKYPDTNTFVADADIVPGADISSNEFTIQASSLTLGLAGTPGDQTVVKGTKDVDTVGITFAAGQASSLRVTDVTLTGYVRDETVGGTYQEGTDDTDTSVSIANAMGNLRLVEAESGNIIADSTKINSNNLNVEDTGTVKFSFAGTPWTIPAGQTKTVLVRTDLSTNAASGTNGDFYAFDINTTTDVTALDDSNNTVNAGNADPNGATAPTHVVTVKNGGSMVLSAHADAPIKGAIYWGQTNAPISKFQLTSTDEAFFVERFTVAASVATEATDSAANVKNVTLTYTNKAGNVLTSTQAFTSGASVNFGWASGDANRPYVPKDGSLNIDVAANLRTKAEGATQDSSSAVFFSLDLVDKYNGSHADGFRAVGEGSGTLLDGTSTNINDVLGSNDQYVYRVFPKFEVVSLPTPHNLIGTPIVFKFSVAAMGLSDSKLRFDNEDSASGSIKFEIVSSGTAGGDTGIRTLDENSVLIDNVTLTNDGDASPNASYTLDFSSKDVEITGGQTKTFSLQLDSTSNYSAPAATGVGADYFQVTLRDDESGLINWVGNYGGNTNALDTASTTGVLRSLPLFGPTFIRQ